MKIEKLAAIFLLLLLSAGVSAQSRDSFLGIKLRPELRAIVAEIEKKTGAEIYAEFVRQEDFMFGSSFISDEGAAVVLIDFSLADDKKKLEAVAAHELLHLRLRVNNYPTFLFSPSVKTARGPAIETEQSNINDLKDLIEHQAFKPEMEKFGLHEILDLAGTTAAQARRKKGQADGQDDAINYARAVLEYPKAADVREVEKIYAANGWNRSLKTGREIADLIGSASLKTPKDAEIVFLKCLLKLYPPPRPNYGFKLTPDPANKQFRRMIVSVSIKRRK